MTCHWANGSPYFQGTAFLWNVGSCLPGGDTVSCPRRHELTTVSQSAQCNIPEDVNLRQHYRESRRSHISKIAVVVREYFSAFVHCEKFKSYIMRCYIRNLKLVWMFHSDWFLLYEVDLFILFVLIEFYVTLPQQLHCYCSQFNLMFVNGKCNVTFPCWQCTSSQLNLCCVCFQWR
jgi:hypothetical protein